ncbi:MAG TPA: metal ABC transporter permease [Candidatus Dormibacteraeota bacterium]|nr:metal ABC transporter permease [Candidatus Dormibacteraeota bacterium]
MIEHWLLEPFQFDVQRRALLEVVIAGGLCGALGAHIILRRLGFMADALSHAVLPGVVIAYIRVGVGGVLYGALAAGVLAASAIGLITRNRRVREDTAIGIVMTGGFALGIVLISTLRSYATALEDFLFGNVLLVSPEDLQITLILAAIVGTVMFVFHRRFVLRAFDPDTAEALGLRGDLLDLVLLMTLAATVVVALRSIGNILVVALLITPAATARLLTDRVLPMMLIGAALGAGSGVVGMIVAYQLNLATGALIVCVATAIFLAVLVLEPRRGLVGVLRSRRRRDVASPTAGLPEAAAPATTHSH